jgi:hypothetical protein
MGRGKRRAHHAKFTLDKASCDTKRGLNIRSVKQNLSVIEREVALASVNFQVSEVFERTSCLSYQRR